MLAAPRSAIQAARRPLRKAQFKRAAGTKGTSGEMNMNAVDRAYAATLKAIRPLERTGGGSAALRSLIPTVIGSIGGERNEGDGAGALDRVLQLPLMERTSAGDAARQDLATLRDELLEHLHILEIDVFDLLDAELADPLAPIKELLFPPGAATRGAGARFSRLHSHRWSLLCVLGVGGRGGLRLGFGSCGNRCRTRHLRRSQ